MTSLQMMNYLQIGCGLGHVTVTVFMLHIFGTGEARHFTVIFLLRLTTQMPKIA